MKKFKLSQVCFDTSQLYLVCPNYDSTSVIVL